MPIVWDAKGRLKNDAPRWARTRNGMRQAFPSYFSTTVDRFATEVGDAIRALNTIKPTPDGPAYLGETPGIPDYNESTDARVPEEGLSLADVVDDSVELFDGMMNLAHPMCMPNVIPPANKAGIIGAMMTNVFSPNIIEGEYAWNVEKAELESSAMLAALFGWETNVAGGVYTYGGSGCYLYALKYALTQVFGPQSRCTGIRVDGKVLCSQQGHYAKMNSTDWSGLGMNNIVDIETDDDTNAMDLEDLEKNMAYFHKEKIPIVCIVCTMGTTDAFAIDDPQAVRALMDKYPNPEGYGPPFLYCDAVIGWSFAMFKGYDFTQNSLGFSPNVVHMLSKNYAAIAKASYADGIGIDFHKTGWATYNCSLFLMANYNHFRELMTRPGSAYLQERTSYNPGLYTLEVSRSGSYAMAGWATLKYLGKQGFQSILGGVLEVQSYFRDKLKDRRAIVCANEEDHGFVTLFRVYPKGVNAEKQYEKELSDPASQVQLVKHNDLQRNVANYIWQWFRSGEKRNGMYGPYTSYTSGFRTTDYNDDLGDGSGVVYAIKSFPMNLNVTYQTMDNLIEAVIYARDQVMANGPPPDDDVHGTIGEPYSLPIGEVVCNGQDQTARSKVHSLVSGVVAGRKKKVGRHIG